MGVSYFLANLLVDEFVIALCLIRTFRIKPGVSFVCNMITHSQFLGRYLNIVVALCFISRFNNVFSDLYHIQVSLEYGGSFVYT